MQAEADRLRRRKALVPSVPTVWWNPLVAHISSSEPGNKIIYSRMMHALGAMGDASPC
jgi:hypothetical protein